MRRLLCVLILALFSCNQQTVFYGSGNVQTFEVPLTDTLHELLISMEHQNVVVIPALTSRLQITLDSNLYHSYSISHDTLLQTLSLRKNTNQELIFTTFACTLFAKTSPKKIYIQNCSLFVDSSLSNFERISVSKDAHFIGTSKRDSLSIEVCDKSSATISGENNKQAISLKNGASYSYTNTPLYEATIQMETNSICSLTVEKYIKGSMGHNTKLYIHGGPLVQVEQSLTASIDYF